jgi:hypothetical protein
MAHPRVERGASTLSLAASTTGSLLCPERIRMSNLFHGTAPTKTRKELMSRPRVELRSSAHLIFFRKCAPYTAGPDSLQTRLVKLNKSSMEQKEISTTANARPVPSRTGSFRVHPGIFNSLLVHRAPQDFIHNEGKSSLSSRSELPPRLQYIFDGLSKAQPSKQRKRRFFLLRPEHQRAAARWTGLVGRLMQNLC